MALSLTGAALRAASQGQREKMGILFMNVGVLVLTLMDAAAKRLVESGYSVIQILAVRAVLISLGLFLFSFRATRGESLRTTRLTHHVARAVIGIFAPALFFFALGRLPLTETTVLFFAAPFMMTALAVPLLKERVARHRWFLIGTGFCGVLIASNPGAATFQLVALLPIASALSYSVMSVMGRWMSKTESVLSMVFYFNLVHALLAGAALPFVWKPMPLADFGVLLLLAVLALAGQFLLTAAFQLGPIGLIAPFEYTQLIFTAIVGFFMFGDVPTLGVVMGAVIIAISGIALARRGPRGARDLQVTDAA